MDPVARDSRKPGCVSVARAAELRLAGQRSYENRKKLKRTWFWTRSLTRSIGAAAVFETAAETPPTRNRLSIHCCYNYSRDGRGLSLAIEIAAGVGLSLGMALGD